MTRARPEASTAQSTPAPCVSARMAATGSSLVASIAWLAPNERASSSLLAGHVDGDDLRAVEEHGRHECAHADSAEPEHRDVAAWLGAQIVGDDARAGGHRAAEQHREVERHAFGHRDEPVLGNQRIFVEGGDRAGVHRTREAGAAIAHAAAVEPAALDPTQHDQLARPHLGDACADLDDLAGAFVAEQVRQVLVDAAAAAHLHELAVAHAAVGELHEHLAAAGGIALDACQYLERRVERRQHCGAHLQRFWVRAHQGIAGFALMKTPPSL